MSEESKVAELKATPGPWIVCQEPKTDYWYKGRTVYNESYGRVADTCILRNDEQAFADAHLIAQSPAMYKALEDAVKIIKEHVPINALGTDGFGDFDTPGCSREWPIRDEHLAHFDGVLAAARGEQRENPELAQHEESTS